MRYEPYGVIMDEPMTDKEVLHILEMQEEGQRAPKLYAEVKRLENENKELKGRIEKQGKEEDAQKQMKEDYAERQSRENDELMISMDT